MKNENQAVKLSSLDDSTVYEIPYDLYAAIARVVFAVKSGVTFGAGMPLPMTRQRCLKVRGFGSVAYRRLLSALASVDGVKVYPQNGVNRLLEEDMNSDSQ